MAENWPTELPQAPLLDGFTSQRMDSRFVSSVDAGLKKVRNRYRAVPKNVTENLSMSEAQKNIFDNFYENILGGGALRFIREDPETLINVSYRFTSVPTYEFNGARYRVSYTAEVLPA